MIFNNAIPASITMLQTLHKIFNIYYDHRVIGWGRWVMEGVYTVLVVVGGAILDRWGGVSKNVTGCRRWVGGE